MSAAKYVAGLIGEDPHPSTSGFNQNRSSSEKTCDNPAVVADSHNVVTQGGAGNLLLQIPGTINHAKIYVNSPPKQVKENTNTVVNEGQCCSSGEDTVSKLNLEELKRHLKDMYRDKVIPSVKWLKIGEDLIFKEYYVELEQTNSTNIKNETAMKIEEMFDVVDGNVPTRVLIESPPGFGKTTLANKMVLDWANGESYMQRFDLTFLILLRNLKKQSIEEELQSIVRECGLKTPIDIGEVNDRNVLVILDGYDEINEISRADVTRVLYRVKAKEMTILVTCRSGVFPLERTDLENVLPPSFSNNKTEFHDKKVTVKGIAEENRREFLQKFCPDRCPDEILATFQKWPNGISKMLRSPMLLFLVSYFNAKEFTLTGSSTITDMYKSLINNIVKTNLTKQGVSIGEPFDLFKISDKNSKKFQELLSRFGDLCLAHLANGDYKFEINEFTRNVYDLGFFIKYKVNGLYESSSYFDCFHLSIMEFSVAYHLWRSYKSQWIFRKIPKIDLLCQVLEKFKATSMIYRFLCDLLENETPVLIAELKKAKCSLFHGEALWKTVSTLKDSDDIVEIISDFVISPVHEKPRLDLIEFYESKFHANIIRAAIKKNDLTIILSNLSFNMNLPRDVVIPEIVIALDKTTESSNCRYLVKNISQLLCKTLILDLRCSSSVFDDWLWFYKSVRVLEEKILIVNDLFTEIRWYVILANHNINFWELQFSSAESFLFFLATFIVVLQSTRVYSVVLNVPFSKPVFYFQSKIISSCNTLCKLLYNNVGERESVDIHELITNKRWISLRFVNCEFNCRESKNPCNMCKKAIRDLKEKGEYCNLNVEESMEICPWQNDLPKYILKVNCSLLQYIQSVQKV